MSGSKVISLAYNTYEPAHDVKNDSPIIFLHGVTASKEYWNEIPQIVADATARKVYAVDSRNHGDSEWTDEFNFDVNVVDLLHFMDKIKAEKVLLVGHSMGGITAMKAALQVPDRIEKLVVEDMTVRKLPQQLLDMVIMYLTLAQTALKNVPSGITIENAKKFIVDFVIDSLPENIKPLAQRQNNDYRILLKQNPDGSYGYKANLKVILEALKDVNSLSVDATGVYEGPVCVIYGKQSPFQVIKDEHLIKGFFPKAQFVGIEDALHGVHTDCPLPFTEALLKFLQE